MSATGTGEEPRPKRVLAIDGGGIRGIIPATVCAAFESMSGRSLYQLFDLFAGTSTGAIICLGLNRPSGPMSAQNIVDLYVHQGDRIFGHPRRLRQLWRPLYSSDSLEKLLAETFGNSMLSDALTETIVTSYDIQLRRPMVFKRWRAKRLPSENFMMRDIARASSAAPTYFAPFNCGDRAFVDGGLFSNNPATVAYAEARRLWPNQRIHVVSLGTGVLTKPLLFSKTRKWGFVRWAVPLIDCLFDGTSKATHYLMEHISEPGAYVRFQSRLAESSERLDDVSETNILALRSVADELVQDRNGEIQRLIEQVLF